MKTDSNLSASQLARYRFCLQGVTSESISWSDWLGNLIILPTSTGRILIEGDLPDQSALFGLLSFIRDLGLVLISIKLIKPISR